MKQKCDVLIIGGGLAGLTAASHLAKAGLRVTVIEKNKYPKHKVCGEYISNEVRPYLQHLGFDPNAFGAKNIHRFQLSSIRGHAIETKLPLGGFGLSRYRLDNQLAQLARSYQAVILHDKVDTIALNDDQFEVSTNNGLRYSAMFVIGAFGKRSNIDTFLNRSFIENASPVLAVKSHYEGEFPEDLVAIHNFKGGYCGVSKVENDAINICYITDYNAFKKHKNMASFQNKVMYQNEHLRAILERVKPTFPAPITISQISFSKKKVVDDHILMCGDSAGMIHPLCGNGMSMAIHSAQLLCDSILGFFDQTLSSREELEAHYTMLWKQEFHRRLQAGRVISKLFELDHLSEFMLLGLRAFPGILPKIIKRTHGKIMEV